MGWNGIERNKLDFILTDLMPVELSELFSYKEFYDFLLQKDNQKVLREIVEELKKSKARNDTVLFSQNWDTHPLKYSVTKGSNSFRRMSLIQPLSALNLYFFIELYQKDLLNYFEKEHCFSLRYHQKSNDLFYKGKVGKAVHYFSNQAKRTGKLAIQQMGTFFRTVPYESLNSFTESLEWRMSNFHFSYFAKIDYKSCFDSIYTHSFKWIIEKNVIDSKNAKNASLFITIDRILQNINGKSSNGLIVGPEFSRMIAEVLLQHIDKKVKSTLSKMNMVLNRDFVAYRFVDDIFIFALTQKDIDAVIATFASISNDYLLQLNDLKISKGETPCLPKEWIAKTRNVSDILNDCFYRKDEYSNQKKEDKHLVKKDFVFISRIKDDITVLIKTHESDKRTIVSYLLSTIFNNISKRKEGYILFGQNGHNRSFMLLDLAFYIYAFCPTYEQTRKLISIIVYINSEISLKNDTILKNKLKNIINRYGFIFHKGNLFDLIDWLVFLLEYGISLDTKTEEAIINAAFKYKDPIILANLLMYSSYNKSLFINMSNQIEKIIEFEIEKITTKSPMLSKEFWFVLIYHNCPYISNHIHSMIDTKIQYLHSQNGDESSKATNIVYDFLRRATAGGLKPKNSFFNWSGVKGLGDKITFRTYQRTVFKRYNKKYIYYSSLD
jgi:hypothetical protein